MKLSNLKKQRGAVLAFSLMMLLLLTLAGTRMIQQNKQQLEIANSARLLTQEFATAEALLDQTKDLLNGDTVDTDGITIIPNPLSVWSQHHDPRNSSTVHIPNSSPDHKCTPTAGKQNVGFAGPIPGVTSATILSVKCKDGDGVVHICSSYPNSDNLTSVNTSTCDPNSTPSTCTATMGINAFTSADFCYQDYPTLPGTTPKCVSEIYTIQIISTNPTNGSERTIISDHAVGCGG